MMAKRQFVNSRLLDGKVCAFCGIADNDEILYGKLVVTDSIIAHSNCMFFASGLSQQGEGSDELLGFHLSDIEAELRRGKKLFCAYCRKRGATIGCCELKCKKSFHLNCGIKNGSLHQFYESFCSYCKEHRPKQKCLRIQADLFCYICCEEIPKKELGSCLYSPCCKKNWFHKICVQKYAMSAGRYFFKCPFCNNSKEFINEMQLYGICIPDKDASWELEENAFEDLLMKPECGAESCKCPRGRNYSAKKKSGWTLLSCNYCGYYARHKNCEKMQLKAWTWTCDECISLNEEIKRNKASAIKTNDAEDNHCENSSTEIKCMPSSSCEISSSVLQNIKNKQLSVKLDVLDLPSALLQCNSSSSSSVGECGDNKEKSSKSIEPVAHKSFLQMSIFNELKNYKETEVFSNSKSVINVNNRPAKKKSFVTSKKVVKKRKAEDSVCNCNDSNHNCIKKYFSPKLESYRL